MKTLDELLERLRVRFDDGTDPHLWGVYMDMIKSVAARDREAVTDRNHPGNAAAMREALNEIRVDAMSDYEQDADYLIEKCNAALSAPVRQCDVGTAEEQAVRFSDAMTHECFADEFCRCEDAALCFAKWAQTPYAEEGAGE